MERSCSNNGRKYITKEDTEFSADRRERIG